MARALTLTTLGHFFTFYAIAFVALHQFIPAMVLPLVVFWRMYLNRTEAFGRALLAGSAACSLVAFALSLPAHFRIAEFERQRGELLECRLTPVGARYPYAEPEPGVDGLFPPLSTVPDADREWGIEPGAVIHYSLEPKPAGIQVNYVLQYDAGPASAGFTFVGSSGGVSAYVRDLGLWREHKEPPMPADFQSSLYRIPRQTQLRTLGVRTIPHLIDLKVWAERMRYWLRKPS